MAVHSSLPSPSPFYQPKTLHAKKLACLYKSYFVFACIRFHNYFISDEQRVVGMASAILYVLVELSFTTLVDEDPKTGKISINWGLRKGVGYSSFAQFWSNVCFAPFMLFGFRYLTSELGLDNSIARVLLFPFNIWILETITGYFIMFLFGRNVAWEYVGPDAFCHGNIRLFFYPFWVMLGVIVEAIFAKVDVMGLAQIGVSFHFTRRVLRIALPLTLMFSPRMKLGELYNTIFSVGRVDVTKPSSVSEKSVPSSAPKPSSQTKAKAAAKAKAKAKSHWCWQEQRWDKNENVYRFLSWMEGDERRRKDVWKQNCKLRDNEGRTWDILTFIKRVFTVFGCCQRVFSLVVIHYSISPSYKP